MEEEKRKGRKERGQEERGGGGGETGKKIISLISLSRLSLLLSFVFMTVAIHPAATVVTAAMMINTIIPVIVITMRMFASFLY